MDADPPGRRHGPACLAEVLPHRSLPVVPHRLRPDRAKQVSTVDFSSTTPGQAAHTAAEAVRALNHLTFGGTGYTWPAQVDDVLGELLVLAERLPQALGQAAAWLEKAHAQGRIGHDTSAQAVGLSVAAVRDALAHATSRADALAAELRIARADSCHLTGVTATGSDDDDADGL